MIELENKFEVGELVTFKTHPLFLSYEIKGDGKQVPPIMIIKEVIFENKQKKTHDDGSGFQIAERIKYICTYFDDNKCEFVESHLYESMLNEISDIKIGRIDDPEKLNDNHKNLVSEILEYPAMPTYEYAKVIYFKTKKLEVLKKRSTINSTIPIIDPNKEGANKDKKDDFSKKKIIQYVVNYASPDFIICGFKRETHMDLFYNDGKCKRKVSTDFVKVKWFNSLNQKFSEEYLPMEFFTDINPFPLKQE